MQAALEVRDERQAHPAAPIRNRASGEGSQQLMPGNVNPQLLGPGPRVPGKPGASLRRVVPSGSLLGGEEEGTERAGQSFSGCRQTLLLRRKRMGSPRGDCAVVFSRGHCRRPKEPHGQPWSRRTRCSKPVCLGRPLWMPKVSQLIGTGRIKPSKIDPGQPEPPDTSKQALLGQGSLMRSAGPPTTSWT